MEAYKQYWEQISQKVAALPQQSEKIELAAKWVAEALGQGGFIYTSGTGHSHIFAEEIYYRAGGFARVRPILDEALMLHKDASRSTEMERLSGYAEQLLQDYPIGPKDVFIISSNSGRNTVSIDMAMIAKSAGAKVIVITNLQHSQSVASRHPSGLKLYEVADVFFDNLGEIGDAAVSIPGYPYKVGPTSTIIVTMLLQGIMVQAATLIVTNGQDPEIFSSSNADGAEAYNDALIAKYKGVIRGL
jgi:uncharacterized phosphosugar-binding protein